MRTGIELPPFTATEELELKMRQVSSDLLHAMQQIPIVDLVSLRDHELLNDIRWNIAEALRLSVDYRRRLVERLRVLDRLAGSPTPAQGSSPQSLQDPPTHAPPGTEPQEGKPITP